MPSPRALSTSRITTRSRSLSALWHARCSGSLMASQTFTRSPPALKPSPVRRVTETSRRVVKAEGVEIRERAREDADGGVHRHHPFRAVELPRPAEDGAEAGEAKDWHRRA